MNKKQEAQAREALAAGFKWAAGMWAYWPSDDMTQPHLRGYRWLVFEVDADGQPSVCIDEAGVMGRRPIGTSTPVLPCLDDAGTMGHALAQVRLEYADPTLHLEFEARESYEAESYPQGFNDVEGQVYGVWGVHRRRMERDPSVWSLGPIEHRAHADEVSALIEALQKSPARKQSTP